MDEQQGPQVAVIGMAGRFPAARDIDAFWNNLRDGVESISFFTDEDLAPFNLDPAVLRDPGYVRAGAFIEDIDKFDAGFFGYAPKEAELIDPQQRLFLEHAWEALENAGYNPETYEGAIGVYAGASLNAYLLGNLVTLPEVTRALDQHQINQQIQLSVGSAGDFLTTRVSYKLNLRGPSHLIQCACSTSLVAIHVACQGLLREECDIALAGGVSINVNQRTGYQYLGGGLTSPDGHCRAFDARAQGIVFGSGVGVVVLKRLEDALADGDTISAIVKGSAINNDGALKVGFTAPSVEGQAEVISEALANADVPADSIGYVETHGTGTPLGDPIEIEALTRAFRASTDRVGFCPIGSVKTNIGHLDVAAGVSGFIKTVLALKHRQLPPSLNFSSPNPQIDFTNSPFYVNTALAEWQRGRLPCRAGVSAFGVGGTNAHIVLEEAPAEPPPAPARAWQLLLLSARSETALEAATDSLAAHLRRNAGLSLADVAYTLQIGRKPFEHRRALVCQTCDDAASTLESCDQRRVLSHMPQRPHPPVHFMFPGGGAQYVQMGRDLYESEPAYRAEIDRCAELLRPHLGLDIREVIYPNRDKETRRPGDKEAPYLLVSWSPGLDPGDPAHPPHPKPLRSETLTRTSVALPALFATEYALARMWMAWGVQPQAMIGHSVGEYVAACLAGVFTLKDALALVALRGRLFDGLPAGAMLNVALPADEIAPSLDEHLALAAINGPAQCVVSGPSDAIEQLAAALADQGIAVRQLAIDVAAHSPLVTPILEEFRAFVATLRLRPPSVRFISNVTGTWISTEDAVDPRYWARHLRETVRFADGVRELLGEPGQILLEVGPGRTLSTLARLQARPEDQVLPSMRHPQARQSDLAFLLNTLGQLWLGGVVIDWPAFYAHERRRRIPLPTYPFERQRYWIEPHARDAPAEDARTSGKRPDIADWFYLAGWKPSMAPGLLQPGELAERPGGWLVFLDDCGIGAAIMQRLAGADQPVVGVLAGERFTRIDDRVYMIDPCQPASYGALIAELQSLGAAPRTILHCWGVTDDRQAGAGPAAFQATQERGYYSLLFLAQALAGAGERSDTRIVVVSNNLQRVHGAEPICPEKATLLGPCKVIPLEYPQISCQSIDIIAPAAGQPADARLIDRLIAESLAGSPDPVIAYRGHERLIQSFEGVRLPAGGVPRQPLRERGVYLITGGLGQVGLHLAEYLAQTLRARLVLLGRSPLPERAEWQSWLAAHDEQDAMSYKIRKLLAFEALGAEVLPIAADVADSHQLDAALRQIDERFGALHGVIHAAGITTGPSTMRPLIAIGRAESEIQFQPKAYGLYALAASLAGYTLDFCILLSSNAAILGGLGYIAYAAANSFMDAFAAQQHSRGPTPWISTNWDYWRTSAPTPYQNELTSMDEYAMDPHESVEVFKRVVTQSTASQVVVATGDLQARLDFWVRREFASATLARPAAALHYRPKLQNSYVAPENQLQQSIAQIWQQALGIDEVGIDDSFFELGGTSLIAIQVIARLKQELNMDISTASLYEGLTIRALVEMSRAEPDLQSWEQGSPQIEEREQRALWRRQYQHDRRAKKAEP